VISPSGEQITITAGDQQPVVGRELVDGYKAGEMSSSWSSTGPVAKSFARWQL
jgi:hypothetical protein